MSTYWRFVIVSLLLLESASSQNFYDMDNINEIEVTFSESNWDYLLDSYVSAGNEERLMGSVSINGEVFDSVGVRYKGNSSYRANQVKNPLNIKLDHIIDDQDIQGYGTLKLANVFKDPSFVRETLGYEIARKYFPASQSNYAKVWINGTYLGLYTNDQDVDKNFMRTHFGSGGHPRFKGEITGSLPPGSMGGVWEYFGTEASDYDHKFVMESDEGWDELIEFLDTLNHHEADVGQVLNLDRHLWFLAFQNLFVNLDGPINNPQNHYLYQDDLGRFNPIPWDLNECFGVFSMLQTWGSLSSYQLQRLDPFVNADEAEYPVISKVLSDPRQEKMYVAHMRTMLAEIVQNGWYEERARTIQDLIASEVQSDPNKFYTYNNFINNLTESVNAGGPPPGQSIIGITELMETRASYLNALPEFTADPPTLSEQNALTLEVDAGNVLKVTVLAENASTVLIRYRSSVTEHFQEAEMRDDGLAGDSLASDGVYTAAGIPFTSKIEYYLYAENGGAGAFLPEHAEIEFFSVGAPGSLVINELLADNETVIADANGEYDDWIELYNPTDTHIDLTGYYLSDDGAELTRWMFPDTNIQAESYLMIWADDDEEQAGLHTNFKLSANGESLFLSNGEGVILDEISWTVQAEDSSFGRYPDATGEFRIMPPTFGSVNQLLVNVEKDYLEKPGSFKLAQNYPNPFNPSTTIRYYYPNAATGMIWIYDLKGREVWSANVSASNPGWYELTWYGEDNRGGPATAGVYLARMTSGHETQTIKMLLLK